VEEPPLAEPWSKTAWRRYLARPEPSRPKVLTRLDYDSLDDLARIKYDLARSEYHSSLAVFDTPLLSELSARLGRLLSMNQYAQP
jgi:hypothetical protein